MTAYDFPLFSALVCFGCVILLGVLLILRAFEKTGQEIDEDRS